MRVAIDTGGTFTDCVYLAAGELQVLKLFSNPADPSSAVLEGLAQISGTKPPEVRHGTTVGTNTMLERSGARVAFVTTAGFEDTISIGRQTRTKLYDWFLPIPVCLVPRALRFGVPERVSAEGIILRSPSDAELSVLVDAVRRSGAEAIAISLLFSFANPETEQRVEAALRCLGLPLSSSHRILPEFREYERASTTVANAYLAPRMQEYLLRLEQKVVGDRSAGSVDVMQSSGGILSARMAAAEPVRTVLSGPAGGVIGACQVAHWAGIERIIGFDMGGTSTDVFLAGTTGAELTRESIVAGVPISIPMLDIHTAGAGGGSLARFDAGGMLRVGPESAGADPGPICFGYGNQATVTDANYLLGRLDQASFLGGGVQLDRPRTEQLMRAQKGSLATAEDFAAGILRVVETQMEKAIRLISLERGHDPREFTLVAFGGGGPLHACSLARALRMATVMVPAMPGALSALGILLADVVRDYSRTVMLSGDDIHRLAPSFAELEQRAAAEFTSPSGMPRPLPQPSLQRSLDVRYRHQGYELNVPYDSYSPLRAMAAFHELHQRRYGFSTPGKPTEIVNLRVRTVTEADAYAPIYREPVPGNGRAAFYAERKVNFAQRLLYTRHYQRQALVPGDVVNGPAMITEYTSATALPPGCRAHVDGYSNLLISIGREQRP